MDRGDGDSMERGRGRAIFPRQTSTPKSIGGDALQKSSSGYGSGEKSKSFGTGSISEAISLCDFGVVQGSEEAQRTVSYGREFGQAHLQREQDLLKRKTDEQKGTVEQLMGDMTLGSASSRKPIVKHGEHGHKIDLTANYLRLKINEKKGVFEYEVKFKPAVDAQYIRFELLNQLKEIIGIAKTFDGTALYLPFHTCEKELVNTVIHPIDGSEVEITIVFKHERLLNECIHLYNVLLKRIMTELQLARLGRHHYDPKGAKLIPQHKLEVWPGYVTAVNEHEGGLLLCCDTSSKVLRTQTVLELMYEVSMVAKERSQSEIKNMLLGACVLTRYNNRLYRVDDVDFSLSPSCAFNRRSCKEETITYKEYYKQQYNLIIKDMTQPMLLSKIKRRQSGMEMQEQLVVLVPELCFLTGLTDEMKNDFRVMKDIATYTRVTPNQRHYSLRQFISSVKSNTKASFMLENWGLQIADQSVELQGRVVDREKICLADGDFDSGQNVDWGNQLTRGRAFEAVDLTNWLVIHCPRDTRCASDLIVNMMKLGPQMGCKIGTPDTIALQDDKTGTYVDALREIIEAQVQLVVIIFPFAREDRYAAVKKICCTELPVASQVVLSKTLSRPDRIRSIVQKIALQINCKIGGSLWTIKNPYKGCLVVGIDVCYQKGQPSVTGFVSSLNPALTRWFSIVNIEKPNQKMSDSLQINIYRALERYYAANNKLPDRIFVYRDGLGEGMIQHTVEHEVKQVLSAFPKVLEDYAPKLTFVNVHKKINTRFFAFKGNNLDNPPPGTVVDHTVNNKYVYDFFLISQNVRQGTVGPTHYLVVHDDSNISPDHIQRFSYKLCHMYYNWPGTVRVPAPCQYANKLASLVGMYTKREPDNSLSERLFFL